MKYLLKESISYDFIMEKLLLCFVCILAKLENTKAGFKSLHENLKKVWLNHGSSLYCFWTFVPSVFSRLLR